MTSKSFASLRARGRSVWPKKLLSSLPSPFGRRPSRPPGRRRAAGSGPRLRRAPRTGPRLAAAAPWPPPTGHRSAAAAPRAPAPGSAACLGQAPAWPLPRRGPPSGRRRAVVPRPATAAPRAPAQPRCEPFLSHPVIAELLTEDDQKTFSPNPYFEDTKLTKAYSFSDDGAVKVKATSIRWKEGMIFSFVFGDGDPNDELEDIRVERSSVQKNGLSDRWEQYARSAYDFFEKDGNRAIVIDELASELGLRPSVPLHVVLQDWIRHTNGKLSFLGFVKLLYGMSSRSLSKMR
ncbi:hypothetical protein ABZP36_034343 [Zizania latifolia]